MGFDELLNEDDYYQYLILRYLEIKKESYTTLNGICEIMGLSLFKTKGYIQSLQLDLIEIGSETQLIYLENNEINVENIELLTVKKIRLLYLNRSEKFILFQAVLFDEVSIEKYRKTNFLSKTKSYEVKKSLKKILKEQDLIYKINKIEGDEVLVRKYLYSVYYEYYNGLPTMFPEAVVEKVKQLIILLSHHFKFSISYTKQIKLKLFLTVLILRIEKKHYLANLENILDGLSIHQNEDVAFAGFIHILSKDKAVLISEWRFLCLFLYCEDIIEHDVLPFEFTNLSKATKLAKDSVNKIFQTISFKKSSSEDEKKVYELALISQMQRIHLKIATFSASVETFSQVNEFTYFEESYPALTTCLLERMSSLVTEGIITEEMQVRLYYDYIFAILKVIKLEMIETKIYVCVDFSHGDNYTNYISEQIKGFKNLNVELQKRITTKTALYVSDFAIDMNNCEQIVWKNPPSANDWENFGNTIIMLKNKKEEAINE